MPDFPRQKESLCFYRTKVLCPKGLFCLGKPFVR
jgi:hypothetical protein